MTETLVNEALAIEAHLTKATKRDQSAIKKLNEIYLDIHKIRSGGRKTPKKVAIKMGAGYVNFKRGETDA